MGYQSRDKCVGVRGWNLSIILGLTRLLWQFLVRWLSMACGIYSCWWRKCLTINFYKAASSTSRKFFTGIYNLWSCFDDLSHTVHACCCPWCVSVAGGFFSRILDRFSLDYLDLEKKHRCLFTVANSITLAMLNSICGMCNRLLAPYLRS